MALSPAPDSIYTVSTLTRLIKNTLEGDFPAVWVRGELSGCRRPESGHLYFALKDATTALLDAVLFRTDALRLGFEPRDGMEVEAFGGITVYEPRGRYQLVARELRPAGMGALLLKLEELKQRLKAEGLFEPTRKKPLPPYPRRVGIVTSPVGAAVRDMVKVLRARWPGIQIVLAPARVQGPGAAVEIAAGIGRFARYGRVDLVIVGRGGGSLEDLWAFNEEIVARAIAACSIPIISAVGHEVDWTLADLVADVRAATPSNAAEIAVRDHFEVKRRLRTLRGRRRSALVRALAERRRRLQTLIEKYGFRRQRDAIGFHQQRIDDLTARLRAAAEGRVARAREWLRRIGLSYGLREWPRALSGLRARTGVTRERLVAAMVRVAHDRRVRLDRHQDHLRALSPRRVLERGYCLARMPDGSLIRGAEVLTAGDRVALEFARGEADAVIEAVRPKGEHGGEERS
jgi:exodeoxyribonuclease VII large subunit